ncbi:uncharacterized protein BP5553_06524 [Venustampulla echinocandica]|uniref:ABM domain-containing protein n=1 Tax=Venustampulla echinocandica TaxID=2656787 RepID=A0A370TK60_9HELO|nr:uncharacterized protein BP5553_06524 [Venustampulla echinocandica]RDL35912.1 hypothetical protein BP5553_06524 [Venustampulla echinocandica]
MTVLEITHLSLSPTSPHTPRSLLPILQTVRASLAEKVHLTHSRFYRSISPKDNLDGREGIYILGSWPSVAAHKAFLTNDELRDEVLGSQEGVLDFVEGIHVRFENDGDKYGGMTNALLPLDAPVVVLERIEISGGNLTKDKKDLQDTTKPWTIFHGCRCECDCVGGCSCQGAGVESIQKEFVKISGWGSREEYQEWRGRSMNNVFEEKDGAVGTGETTFLLDLESDWGAEFVELMSTEEIKEPYN